MKTRDERKINKLEKRLHAMARKKAAEFIDESVSDLAASRIIQSFAEDLMQVRALDWKMVYGMPETLEDKTKAAEFICGKGYVEYLVKNPGEVKELLEAYLETITVRLSGRTMREAVNEN